jgi:hypothetical protein
MGYKTKNNNLLIFGGERHDMFSQNTEIIKEQKRDGHLINYSVMS